MKIFHHPDHPKIVFLPFPFKMQILSYHFLGRKSKFACCSSIQNQVFFALHFAIVCKHSASEQLHVKHFHVTHIDDVPSYVNGFIHVAAIGVKHHIIPNVVAWNIAGACNCLHVAVVFQFFFQGIVAVMCFVCTQGQNNFCLVVEPEVFLLHEIQLTCDDKNATHQCDGNHKLKNNECLS